jgi:hypothetical protein
VWDAATGSSRIHLPPGAGSSRSWRRSQCRAFLQEVLSDPARTLVAADFGFGLPWGADLAVFGVQGWREMIGRIHADRWRLELLVDDGRRPVRGSALSAERC